MEPGEIKNVVGPTGKLVMLRLICMDDPRDSLSFRLDPVGEGAAMIFAEKGSKGQEPEQRVMVTLSGEQLKVAAKWILVRLQQMEEKKSE